MRETDKTFNQATHVGQAALFEQAAKRREIAKQAAVTRARRRESTLYRLVARYLQTGVLTPADKCRCCGKRLSDPQSQERGIGSECWGRFLQSVDKAKTHGAAVDAWDLTIDEIMREAPCRENHGKNQCPVCNQNRDWRATAGGKTLCSSCFGIISFEAARRLRHTPAEDDGAGFREWIERERFVCSDPTVCAAQRAATVARERLEHLEHFFAQEPEAYWTAKQAETAARESLKCAETSARERFYAAGIAGTPL